MKLKSVVELTPLLDVFLILIFAFMIKANQDIQISKEDLKKMREQLSLTQDSLVSKQQLIASYQENLDSSQVRVLRLESALSEQKIQLNEGIKALSEKLEKFFGTMEIELEAMVEDGELNESDFDYFKNQIAAFQPENHLGIIQKIYTLTELEAYATVFDVYLDSSNEISLYGEPTGVALYGYDESEDRFPPERVEAFVNGLENVLDEAYRDKLRSTEKVGDIVLITFGYSNDAMRGGIKLSDRVINDYYKALEDRESGRKVFYAPLGFYPTPQ